MTDGLFPDPSARPFQFDGDPDGMRHRARGSGHTFNDRVAALFSSRPGVWIDGRELAGIAGLYGWRTRVSEVRRFYGLNIINRQRKVGAFTVSEYRYLPSDGDLGGAA